MQISPKQEQHLEREPANKTGGVSPGPEVYEFGLRIGGLTPLWLQSAAPAA